MMHLFCQPTLNLRPIKTTLPANFCLAVKADEADFAKAPTSAGLLQEYYRYPHLFAFFRFYDPEALDCYMMSVNEAARERLLGPLTAMVWPTLELDGQGVEAWTWNEAFRSSDSALNKDMVRADQPPVRLTEEQLDAFERYKEEKMARWLLQHKFRLLTP